MNIKKADGTLVNRQGQLVPGPPAIPKDVPEIVDGYIHLVASLVHGYKGKSVNDLKPADVKNIIALGRSVAMLQVIEVNKLANVGHKAVKDLTTEEIKGLLAAPAETSTVTQVATYVEMGEDDE